MQSQQVKETCEQITSLCRELDHAFETMHAPHQFTNHCCDIVRMRHQVYLACLEQEQTKDIFFTDEDVYKTMAEANEAMSQKFSLLAAVIDTGLLDQLRSSIPETEKNLMPFYLDGQIEEAAEQLEKDAFLLWENFCRSVTPEVDVATVDVPNYIQKFLPRTCWGYEPTLEASHGPSFWFISPDGKNDACLWFDLNAPIGYVKVFDGEELASQETLASVVVDTVKAKPGYKPQWYWTIDAVALQKSDLGIVPKLSVNGVDWPFQESYQF